MQPGITLRVTAKTTSFATCRVASDLLRPRKFVNLSSQIQEFRKNACK